MDANGWRMASNWAPINRTQNEDPEHVELFGLDAIVAMPKTPASPIEQAGKLYSWRTGLHKKVISVCLSSLHAGSPASMRISVFFQERCIRTRRLCRLGRTGYITLRLIFAAIAFTIFRLKASRSKQRNDD